MELELKPRVTFEELCIGAVFRLYDEENIIYLKLSNSDLDNCLDLTDDAIVSMGEHTPVLQIYVKLVEI